MHRNFNHFQGFGQSPVHFELFRPFASKFLDLLLNKLILTFRQVLDVAKGFCSDDTTDRTVPPLLLLLLSRTCLDLQTATIQNIMSSVDEQFFIDDTSGGLTTIARLGSSFKSMSQELLNHYAR